MCFRPFKAVISLQFAGRSPAAETQHPKLWQLKCPPNPCSMKPSLHPLTTIISYKLYIANGQFAWVYYILSKCMCTNINLSLTLTETEVSPHLGQLGTLTTTSKPETARVARWTCPILAEPMGTLPFFVFENFMAHMPFKQNISSKIVFNKIKSTILSSTFFFVRYFCFPSVEKSEDKHTTSTLDFFTSWLCWVRRFHCLQYHPKTHDEFRPPCRRFFPPRQNG